MSTKTDKTETIDDKVKDTATKAVGGDGAYMPTSFIGTLSNDHRKSADEYASRLVNLLKPGEAYKLVKPELDKALPRFREEYVAKATSGEKLEVEYNKVAAAFITALYGIAHDSPHIAGNELKSWLQKVGNDALPRLKAAIQIGNQTEIEGILAQAYQAQADKIETTMAEVREKPEGVRLGFYERIASLVGDVDGYRGSTVSVSENPSAAVSALGQRLATAKTFSKN